MAPDLYPPPSDLLDSQAYDLGNYFGVSRTFSPVCRANQPLEIFHSSTSDAHAKLNRLSSCGINLVISSIDMCLPGVLVNQAAY